MGFGISSLFLLAGVRGDKRLRERRMRNKSKIREEAYSSKNEEACPLAVTLTHFFLLALSQRLDGQNKVTEALTLKRVLFCFFLMISYHQHSSCP